MGHIRDVKRTERGWAGHFCGASQCRFRRNTLLECGDVKIVVSTVGLRESSSPPEEFSTLDSNSSYFETMAFHSDPTDTRYRDADVTRQVYFESECGIDRIDADDEANDMHEAAVNEISYRLSTGEKFDAKTEE